MVQVREPWHIAGNPAISSAKVVFYLWGQKESGNRDMAVELKLSNGDELSIYTDMHTGSDTTHILSRRHYFVSIEEFLTYKEQRKGYVQPTSIVVAEP